MVNFFPEETSTTARTFLRVDFDNSCSTRTLNRSELLFFPSSISFSLSLFFVVVIIYFIHFMLLLANICTSFFLSGYLLVVVF